ncbi:ORF1a [Hedgehog arterivirus]
MNRFESHCVCGPEERVFVSQSDAYCVRCLSRRVILTSRGDASLSPLSHPILHAYWDPVCPPAWASNSVTKTPYLHGECWLSTIFPIARMTSGNNNFRVRLAHVARTLYRDGCLTSKALDELGVYARGAHWHVCNGPIPGVAIYAGGNHVSDTYHPGATHVLTNLELLTPITRVPFTFAYDTMAFRIQDGFVIYSNGWVCWADEHPSANTPLPAHLDYLRHLPDLVPMGQLVKADWIKKRLISPHEMPEAPNVSRTLGYRDNDSYSLALTPPTCWLDLFPENTHDELQHYVNSYGYQTKWGIPGPLINRLLQQQGLKAVKVSKKSPGSILVTKLAHGAWQWHVRLESEQGFNYPVIKARIKVIPNTEITTKTTFKFPDHTFVGGRARSPQDCTPIQIYDPPKDGKCGMHCISAIINHINRGLLKSTIPESLVDFENWLTDQDICELIRVLNLPASLKRVDNLACPSARYTIQLSGSHWYVVASACRNRMMKPECIQGVCDPNHEIGRVYTPTFKPKLFKKLTKAYHQSLNTMRAMLKDDVHLSSNTDSEPEQSTEKVRPPTPAPRLSLLALASKSSTGASQPPPVPAPRVRTLPVNGDVPMMPIAAPRTSVNSPAKNVDPLPAASQSAAAQPNQTADSLPNGLYTIPEDLIMSLPSVHDPPPVASDAEEDWRQVYGAKKKKRRTPVTTDDSDWETMSSSSDVTLPPPPPRPRGKPKPAPRPAVACRLRPPPPSPNSSGWETLEEAADSDRDDTPLIPPAQPIGQRFRLTTMTGTLAQSIKAPITRTADRVRNSFNALTHRFERFFSPNLPHLRATVLSALTASLDTHDPGFAYAACSILLTWLLLLVSPWFCFVVLAPIRYCGRSGRLLVAAFVAFAVYAGANLLHSSIQLGDCDINGPGCASVLRRISASLAVPRPTTPVFGISGIAMCLFARIVGGGRYTWLLILRLSAVADICLVLLQNLLFGRCRRCFRKCIRCKTGEVLCLTYPTTKIPAQALIRCCDLTDGSVDFVEMLTGIPGCYTGKPLKAAGKPVPYKALDKEKVNGRTLIPPPTNSNQAQACVKALLAGATIVDGNPSPVVRVTTVPFASCYFPDVPVDANTSIVVDAETYNAIAASHRGAPLSKLIIGEGDFAAINQVIPGGMRSWATPIITRARSAIPGLNITNLLGSGYVQAGGPIQLLLSVTYMVACACIGAALQIPSSCGVGTNDPFCSNPFADPVVGSHGMCDGSFCVSTAGVSAASPTISHKLAIVGLCATIIFCATVSFIKAVGVAECAVLVIALLTTVWAPFAWLSVLLPLILARGISLQLLGIFSVTMVFLSPIAGAVTCALFACAYITRFIPSSPLTLIMPKDIHNHTATPQGAAALASAKSGSYLDAVKQSAMSGRAVLWVPTHAGVVLEGAFRSKHRPNNAYATIGKASGVSTCWREKNNLVVLTAAHLLNEDGTATLMINGQPSTFKFSSTGDLAVCRTDGIRHADFNLLPAYTESQCRDTRAYWYTLSGVEPGIVLQTGAVCFTSPGDSGAAVVAADGGIIGVHTGSNQKGFGLITALDGTLVGGKVPLSKIATYFDGHCVPTPSTLPVNIIADMPTVPQPLAELLSGSVGLEGALNPIQLTVIALLLFRFSHHAFTPMLAVVFFFLNEILPRTLTRMLFSFCLSCLSFVSGSPGWIFVLRLFTAALNRNRSSLVFFSLGGIVSFLIDWPFVTFSNFLFLPSWVNPYEAILGSAVIHSAVLILSLLKYGFPAYVLCGDGNFDRVFLARFFLESDEADPGLATPPGPIKSSVTSSLKCNTESLAGVLAAKLSSNDLEWLKKYTDAKVVKSASNLRDCASSTAELVYAKALRSALSGVTKSTTANSVLAALDSFLTDTPTPILNGDTVVVLTRMAEGETTQLGNVMLTCVDVRHVGGSFVSICEASEVEGSNTIEFVKLKGKNYLRQNGKFLVDAPKEESAPSSTKDKKRKKEKREEWMAISEDPYSYEGDSVPPKPNLPTPMSIEAALAHMGIDTTITQKERERLQALIKQLQDIVDQNSALN